MGRFLMWRLLLIHLKPSGIPPHPTLPHSLERVAAMQGLTFPRWEKLGYCNLDWPVSGMLWMGTMKKPECAPSGPECLHVINFSLSRIRRCWNDSFFCRIHCSPAWKRPMTNQTLFFFFFFACTLKNAVTNMAIWIVVEEEEQTTLAKAGLVALGWRAARRCTRLRICTTTDECVRKPDINIIYK